MYTDVHCYCLDTFLLLELMWLYLWTIWPSRSIKAFATEDQTNETTVRLLVDHYCWWTTIVQGHYRTGLTKELTTSWHLAQQNITKAQKHQKEQYDKHVNMSKYEVRGRVMVFLPHSKTDKLSMPYHGPYRIVDVFGNTVRPMDKPKEKPILVNVDRVTLYLIELPNSSWLGPRVSTKKRKWAQTRYNLCTWTENYNLCSLGSVRTGSGC